MNNLLKIPASAAYEACKDAPDLEQRLLAAMKAVREFRWMLPDDGQLAAAALAGAMAASNGDDRRQLERLAHMNNALDAAMKQVPVDLDKVLDRYGDLPPWPCRPFGELWAEVDGDAMSARP